MDPAADRRARGGAAAVPRAGDPRLRRPGHRLSPAHARLVRPPEGEMTTGPVGPSGPRRGPAGMTGWARPDGGATLVAVRSGGPRRHSTRCDPEDRSESVGDEGLDRRQEGPHGDAGAALGRVA